MNQTPESPDKINQIEAILLRVAQQQEQTQQQIDRFTETVQASFSHLSQQQDRTQQQIDQVSANQDRTQQQIDRVSANVTEMSANVEDMSRVLRESIPDLTAMMGEVLHNLDTFTAELRAELAADRADRAVDRLAESQTRNEFRRQMTGLQNESRNILRELAEMRRQERRNRDN